MESNSPIEINAEKIAKCFEFLHSPNSSSQLRKQADNQLINMEANCMQLLPCLLQLFQNASSQSKGNQKNLQIATQSLIYFSNVVKRQWCIRRKNKAHSQFDNIKKILRNKLLEYTIKTQISTFISIIFNTLSFICNEDYPSNFSSFNQFLINFFKHSANRNDNNNVKMTKQIKQIFVHFIGSKRKATKKQFQQEFNPILKILLDLGKISIQHLQQSKQKNQVIITENFEADRNYIKISKYRDQILLSLLGFAPYDIFNEVMIQAITYSREKIKMLFIRHENTSHKEIKIVFEKNLKSLIFSLQVLQGQSSFFIGPIIEDYLQIIIHFISNCRNFLKSHTLRYSLLALRRFIRDFNFYSQDNIFFNSIGKKVRYPNFLQIRKYCSEQYHKFFTSECVQELMNILITEIMSIRYPDQTNQGIYIWELQQGGSIEKDQYLQKQLSTSLIAALLMQALLQRFPGNVFQLFRGLLANCLQNNWSFDDHIQNNIFTVLSLLPRFLKSQYYQKLSQIPTLDILAHIYNNKKFRHNFPAVVNGWVQVFTDDQVSAVITVLLQLIKEQSKIQTILNASQALNRVFTIKITKLDINSLVQQILPVAFGLFAKTDNPEILWPMINLISTLIVKPQFNSSIIIKTINADDLKNVLTSQSGTLIQALIQMLKNFLCIIPRHVECQAIYRITAYFLNVHLLKINQTYFEKILNLWYISIREYSHIQNCPKDYIDLFYTHFRRIFNCNRSVTLIYIIQQYMLLQLIDEKLPEYVKLVEDVFKEAKVQIQNQLNTANEANIKEITLQCEQINNIKVASLSFYITLITKYGLQRVNTQSMLALVLQNLFNPFNKVAQSEALRNSLLSIINRYLILFKQQFFAYLQKNNVSIEQFLQVYLANMQFITSRTAQQINAIALISLFNSLNEVLLGQYLKQMLKKIIPALESRGHFSPISGSAGKVQNSPNIRFASNVLSARKEQIRKVSGFGTIDIHNVFKKEINNLLSKHNLNHNSLLNLFNEDPSAESWVSRLRHFL